MELNQKDKAKDLSSGLAAKLKIAATLARKAELYMLDEPLNGIYVLVMGIFVLVLAYVSITSTLVCDAFCDCLCSNYMDVREES